MGEQGSCLEIQTDGAFVINLAKRTDRWAAVQDELAKIRYKKYERFDAYGPDNPPPDDMVANAIEYVDDGTGGADNPVEFSGMTGWWGNKFSHMGVIAEAKRRGYRSVMVFEDDVTFHPQFDWIVGEAIKQIVKNSLRPDWLQFGGNHRWFAGKQYVWSSVDGRKYEKVVNGLEPVADNLSRIHRMLTAHAYLVRNTVYDFILAHAAKSPWSIDGFYAYEVHPRFKCYSVVPCCARQRAGENDIGGGYADYVWHMGE